MHLLEIGIVIMETGVFFMIPEQIKWNWLPFTICGSCLYPQADNTIMNAVLTDKNEMHYRIFEIPTSAIMLNGKRIKYFDFISSLKNEDCNAALKRLVPNINMTMICKMVEETPFISELQKEFYITMLKMKKERIFDFSYKKLL